MKSYTNRYTTIESQPDGTWVVFRNVSGLPVYYDDGADEPEIRFYPNYNEAKTAANVLYLHYQAIEFAKAFFDQTRVVRLSKFADNEGKPLHGEKFVNQFETNMDMFTDLIGLVLAQTLYILPVENSTRFSGFSSLAVSIKQRPDIVRSLMFIGNPIAA